MCVANFRRQDNLGVSNSLIQRGDFIDRMEFRELYGPLSSYSRLQVFIQTIRNVAKFGKQYRTVPSGVNKLMMNTYYFKRNISN